MSIQYYLPNCQYFPFKINRWSINTCCSGMDSECGNGAIF